MENTSLSSDHARTCEHCSQFSSEQWNLGFCAFHRMYVVKNFDCPQFTPKETEPTANPPPRIQGESIRSPESFRTL